jgi:hypothetical protein
LRIRLALGFALVHPLVTVACGGQPKPAPDTANAATSAQAASTGDTSAPSASPPGDAASPGDDAAATSAAPTGDPNASDGGSAAPSIHGRKPKVTGRLPWEVVQRIVMHNNGDAIRSCYQDGLRTTPGLKGRVAVHFVIDKTGAVKSASDAGSDLADKAVVQCVVHAIAGLSFPEPESGSVDVVYPIVFGATQPPH